MAAILFISEGWTGYTKKLQDGVYKWTHGQYISEYGGLRLVTGETGDIREEVILALNAKFPVLKRLFSIRRIGIFGPFAHGDDAPDAQPEIEVEFEPGADTYRNYIGLSYYLDGLFGREIRLVTRRLVEDFISGDAGGDQWERKQDRACISRMSEEISFLLARLKGVDFRGFSKDELLRRASIRSLEVIGECALQVSPALKKAHPEIAWTELAGMRIRFIHPYFGPDWVLVWDILEMEIPRLESQIRGISSW
jgi:uncharacterized protein with HEPN domain/predicted nucleotidyltransferase